jgi:molecular chaperone Hsp33
VNETQNFVFEDHGIRGGVVRLHETWLQTIAQHAYPQDVRDTLGQAVAATVLLAASLKDQPKISLQLQGDGPLRLLLVQCTGDLKVRATVQWNQHAPHEALIGSGRLAVNVDTGRENGFFQGIVPLVGPTLPECIESYFAQSEQLATRFFLFGDEQVVGGLVLQMLPGADDTETFAQACTFAETMTAAEITTSSAANLLPRLFDGYTIRLFDARPVGHDCRCTPEHLASIARMLGREELESIITSSAIAASRIRKPKSTR